MIPAALSWFVLISASLLAHTFNDSARNASITIVVTGATGRTGSLVYRRLKAENVWNVRAFVRNATKAQAILNCSRCDASEGIYIGDLSKPDTIQRVMRGADILLIATGSQPHCTGTAPFRNCVYTQGADPKSIDWQGTQSQVTYFASAEGVRSSKRILYVSTMGTTMPDNFLDKLGHGHTVFYHLQAEAFIMSSGVPFTIVKACGLGEGAAGKNKLVVGHDDGSFNLLLDHLIQRDDVARVLVEAVRHPEASSQLRFDLCSQFLGKPTTNIVTDVFDAARYPWDQISQSTNNMI